MKNQKLDEEDLPEFKSCKVTLEIIWDDSRTTDGFPTQDDTTGGWNEILDLLPCEDVRVLNYEEITPDPKWAEEMKEAYMDWVDIGGYGEEIVIRVTSPENRRNN